MRIHFLVSYILYSRCNLSCRSPHLAVLWYHLPHYTSCCIHLFFPFDGTRKNCEIYSYGVSPAWNRKKRDGLTVEGAVSSCVASCFELSRETFRSICLRTQTLTLLQEETRHVRNAYLTCAIFHSCETSQQVHQSSRKMSASAICTRFIRTYVCEYQVNDIHSRVLDTCAFIMNYRLLRRNNLLAPIFPARAAMTRQ